MSNFEPNMYTNLETVQNISFIKWVEATYPCNDDTQEKDELYNLFSNALDTFPLFIQTKDTFKCILDSLSTLLNVEPNEPNIDAVLKVCEGLHILRNSWFTTVPTEEYIEVYNGYTLNTSTIPCAVQFWKHLILRGMLPKNRRMTRANLENEFNLYIGRNGKAKFSHVLFNLSWLNILRVYNNSSILLNVRNQIAFQ